MLDFVKKTVVITAINRMFNDCQSWIILPVLNSFGILLKKLRPTTCLAVTHPNLYLNYEYSTMHSTNDSLLIFTIFRRAECDEASLQDTVKQWQTEGITGTDVIEFDPRSVGYTLCMCHFYRLMCLHEASILRVLSVVLQKCCS